MTNWLPRCAARSQYVWLTSYPLQMNLDDMMFNQHTSANFTHGIQSQVKEAKKVQEGLTIRNKDKSDRATTDQVALWPTQQQ